MGPETKVLEDVKFESYGRASKSGLIEEREVTTDAVVKRRLRHVMNPLRVWGVKTRSEGEI